MKKLTGLVVILAVLILGGFYGMGVLTENTIKKNIQVINQSNGLYADIEQYNRGWFNSNASIKWRLQIPERIVKDDNGNSKTVPAQSFTMEMPVKIFHGPVIYADSSVHFGMGYAQTEFVLPAKYDKQFDETFTKDSMKPQLNLSIFVNYLNKSTVILSIPAFKLIAKEGNGNFDWYGMDSNTTMASKLQNVDGTIVINGMKISKDDTKVNLGKVTSDFALHKTASGLFLGNASFNLPSFDVTVKDKKMFEIKEFSLSSSSEIENNLFSSHFNADLQNILANGQGYGPGEIEVSLRNLDAEVLARINEQANAMQNGTDAERQKAMVALLPEIPKLFSKGPEFEISKLSFKLPEGTIEGNLMVSLPKGENSNPFDLIQKIQGNARMKMPKVVLKMLLKQSIMQRMAKQPDLQDALIEKLQGVQGNANLSPEQLAEMQSDKQISSMEQSGLIVADGSDYVISLNLEQGKFTVNDRQFNPSMISDF